MGVGARPRPFDEAPFLVLWELTRACQLACKHCRAEALDRRDPMELSLAEGLSVLKEIKDMGTSLVVLTGGDPLRHPHAFDLIEAGSRLGLRMTMTPSGTPLLTPAAVRRMKEAGLSRMAVSLDGPDAAGHDAFRGVPGSFGWTWDAIEAAHEVDLEVQINSSLCRQTVGGFEALSDLVGLARAVLWSVFFVVPVGRAGFADELTADEFESLFLKLADLGEKAPFDIKTTAAPHYRRHLLQRSRGRPHSAAAGDSWRAARGVNDGNGLAFISHTGDVYPSGFLPLAAGNVRSEGLAWTYRESPLFRELRNPDALEGKCGTCLYRKACGGSRARAYAFTGNPMAEEPCCVYRPEASERERQW